MITRECPTQVWFVKNKCVKYFSYFSKFTLMNEVEVCDYLDK